MAKIKTLYKLRYGRWRFEIFHRRFSPRNLHLNFIPMIDAVDIADDFDYDHIIGRWYNCHFLTLGLDIRIPQDRYIFKKAFGFPPADWFKTSQK